MASLFSKPKTPKVVPTAMPTELDPSVLRASQDRRKRMMAAVGREGTILTALGGRRQQLGLMGDT